MLRLTALLFVLLVSVSCASNWDIGKGSAEIRRTSEPAKETKNGETVQNGSR